MEINVMTESALDYIGPQKQTCKSCGRPDLLTFHVPDKIWNAIAPVQYRNKVLCLICFDAYAAKLDIDYTPHIQELYFAGNGACFLLRPTESFWK